MPFENGEWRQPNDGEQATFANQISSKVVREIVPTPDLVQAIAQQMEGPKIQPRLDLTPAFERATAARPDMYDENNYGTRKGGADIVIPIYGGLHVLKQCVGSIIKHTKWPYHLILVDDASPDQEVRNWLAEFQKEFNYIGVGMMKHHSTGLTILHNPINRGFPATVNRGVAAGSNPYVCILNSDTMVTPGWLTNQLIALEADKRNVIVNPVTNNTALINVNMYNGKSYLDMAHALSVAPNTPTFNEIMPTGFCFTLRRKLWNEVGPFDEAFGSGYGEETSFWMNALKQTDKDGTILDNQAVIADNAYVYHERGTSFSQLGEDVHMGMREQGSKRFHKLHPDFGEWRKGHDAEAAIGHLRREIPQEAFALDYKGNIAWVVKSAGPCGGMNFIADIVNQLIEEGYNAKVCVVPDQYTPEMEGKLPVTQHLRTSPLLFKDQKDFVERFPLEGFNQGIVLAAVTERSQAVAVLCNSNRGLRGYNHVQSYDAELAAISGHPELLPAILEAYNALPNIVSSGWIAQELRSQGIAVAGTVLPGVDPDLFHPRGTVKDDRKTIAILVQGTETPQNSMTLIKGAQWGVEFLKHLEPAKHPNLRVIAIGPTSLPVRGVTCVGGISQSKMADLMGGQADFFVDPALIHSYGLPALEALYSGCDVITRSNRGIDEYREAFGKRVNVIDDPKAAAEFVLTAQKVEDGPDGRSVVTNRHEAVKSFIEFLFPDHSVPGFKVEVVTPHMRKHGGPTTLVSAAQQLAKAGHETNLTMIYTDWNPEILKAAKPLPVRTNWDEEKNLDVVFINSDNPFAAQIMAKRPGAKFVMIKLSHNPRFQQTENDNLNLPWDHIVTSTGWLRQACITPLQGWTHQAWPEDKVSVVGWYHYGHPVFDQSPSVRTYGTGMSGFKIGTLIHEHPLKGSREAMAVFNGLKRKYENRIQCAGFGEVKANTPEWMQYFKSAGRKDLAHYFKQLDVWLGASHSEGLGRMALEAMSAGVVVVTTDTGAEFLRNGENCLLYPAGNAQKGAEMVDLLVNDQELFTKLAINGYRTAVAAGNPDNFRHNLNVIVRRVMGGK